MANGLNEEKKGGAEISMSAPHTAEYWGGRCHGCYCGIQAGESITWVLSDSSLVFHVACYESATGVSLSPVSAPVPGGVR